MADPVYQDQPYMRKSFLFFSDVYLTGAVQEFRRAFSFFAHCGKTNAELSFSSFRFAGISAKLSLFAKRTLLFRKD